MTTIKLYDSAINAINGQANPQSQVGDVHNVDVQKIMAMIANEQVEEAVQLLNQAGLTVQRFEENGSVKIVFKFNNKEYTVISNPPSSDVVSVNSASTSAVKSSYAIATMVNMDDDIFTKEEIHKLGFVSEKDLAKYFDCKNGVYTLKSGLVVEGKSVNSTQELMNILGMMSLDDYFEKTYGNSKASTFSYGAEWLSQRAFNKFCAGEKDLASLLQDMQNITANMYYNGAPDYAYEMYQPSKYIYCLLQEGYITESDFPTDNYENAVAYIQDAFNRYHQDVANSTGKNIKDLTKADVMRDLYTKGYFVQEENKRYRDYTVNNVCTFDVQGYGRGNDGTDVRSYFQDIIDRTGADPINDSPYRVIERYIFSISEDKQFNNAAIQAIFKAAGVTENDSLEEKVIKVNKLLTLDVAKGINAESDEYGAIIPALSWEDLYLYFYDNGFIEQSTYSADEIKLLGSDFYQQREDGNFYGIEGESDKPAFYQDGVDKDGNPVYKASHAKHTVIFDGRDVISQAQAVYNGYTVVTNAQELIEALKRSEPIVLMADIDMSSVKDYLYIGTESQPYPQQIFTNGYTIKNLNGEVHIDANNVHGQRTEQNPEYRYHNIVFVPPYIDIPWYTQVENINKSNPVYLPIGTQGGTVGTAILYNYVHINGYDGKSPLDYVYDKNGNKVAVTDSNWFEILTHADDYTLPGDYSLPELNGEQKSELVKQAAEKLWNESFDMYDATYSLDMSGYLNWVDAIITSMGGTIKDTCNYVSYTGSGTSSQGHALVTYELDGHTYTVPLQNDFANKNNTFVVSSDELEAFLQKHNLPFLEKMFPTFRAIDGDNVENSVTRELIAYLDSQGVDYLGVDGKLDLDKAENYILQFINNYLTTSSVQHTTEKELPRQSSTDSAIRNPELPQRSKHIINEYIIEGLTKIDSFSIDESMLDNLVHDADYMIGDAVRSLSSNDDEANYSAKKSIRTLNNRIKVINRLSIHYRESIKLNQKVDVYEALDNIDIRTVEELKAEFDLSDYEYNSLKQSIGQYILSKVGANFDVSSVDIIDLIREYLKDN